MGRHSKRFFRSPSAAIGRSLESLALFDHVAHDKYFISSNFHFYERIARPDLGESMLHQKVASFGLRGPMIIGSANLDAQSFVHNGEAVIVVQDQVLRRSFDAMVLQDSAPGRARLVPQSELSAPSLVERLKQFTAGKLAWYWL